jgi:hypothetical protein
MQYHIFLIYSRQDTDIMKRVRDSLQADGLIVWIDEAYEPGTPNWKSWYETAIQSAGCCVVILSPDSNGSAFVEQQLDHARKAGLRIFPVIGRGDEWSAVPKAFIGTQMIDVRANHDARMARLIGLIKSHLGMSDS